jgi:phosphoglycolate phosphatase-like HAD superfamily hydrolase
MTSGHGIEIIAAGFTPRRFRAVLFDFDGTLSLLRRNWQDVMIPMMVEILQDTGTSESQDELRQLVEEFVMQLNGKQTIYQMIQLDREVQQRGGPPCEPLFYKKQYHDLLWKQVGQRVTAVRTGQVPAEQMQVPGTVPLLAALQDHELDLYLASGTDLEYVEDEVRVLQLERFFGRHIYGALDDYKNFSKAQVIQRIIRESGVPGEEILGFGDGFVEIEEVNRVGGVTVGVASDELQREGINRWKRERLIRAGAMVIVPDYRQLHPLLATLGLGEPGGDK